MKKNKQHTSKSDLKSSQVPKRKLTHSGDVEFAPELTNQDNKEARARSERKSYQVERE